LITNSESQFEVQMSVANLLNQTIWLKYVDESKAIVHNGQDLSQRHEVNEVTCRLDEQASVDIRATLSKMTIDELLLTRLVNTGVVDGASINETLKAKLGLRISVSKHFISDEQAEAECQIDSSTTTYAPIHLRQTDDLCKYKSVMFKAPLAIQAILHSNDDQSQNDGPMLHTLFLRTCVEPASLLANHSALLFTMKLANRLSFKIVNNKHTWSLRVIFSSVLFSFCSSFSTF
jgi:hypothetical protein